MSSAKNLLMHDGELFNTDEGKYMHLAQLYRHNFQKLSNEMNDALLVTEF